MRTNIRNLLNYSNLHLIYIHFYFSIGSSVACRGYKHETALPKLALVSVYASVTGFNKLVMLDMTGRCNNNTYALKIQRGLSYLRSSRSTKNDQNIQDSSTTSENLNVLWGRWNPQTIYFPFREMLMMLFCLKDI